MTKTIEEAAKEAVRKEYLCEKCAWKDDCDFYGGENTAFDCCECPADSYEDGFKAGAKFALGKQEKDADTVIQGWVCRDKYWQKDIFPSDLFLAMEKPKRNEEWKTWTDMGAYIPLNTELFPDLTWDSDPEPVEIIIKRKKK